MTLLLVLTLGFIEKASAKLQSQSCQFEPENAESPFIIKATEIALQEKLHNLIVLDLGVGTGRNIKDLLKKDATVYAYDADPESVNLIRTKFRSFLKNKKLYVDQAFFEDMNSLPPADLIIAWRSLPFMDKDKFPAFWKKIEEALTPDGLFTGTFFGEQHKTRRPLDRPKLFRLTREEVLNLFKDFLIMDFQEEIKYDEEVSKEWGSDQFEHVYKVIAKKKETARN